MPTTAYSASKTSEPASPDVRPTWAKVFSFPVMCMFLFAAVIFAYAPRGIGVGEGDIWWHLRNAQALLQQHSLSSLDTYSFTAAGSPWLSVEWLSEVPFYLAFKGLGMQGIVAFYSMVTVLIFAGVYYRSCRAGADCKDAAIVTLAGICLAGVSLAPRTVLLGWLCLIGELLVLDHFRRSDKGLWLLPPLFVLWINLHGSWVYGMVVLAITIVAGVIDGEWGVVVASRWSMAELKKLLLAFAASLAALFINPFGYKPVLFPFTLFRMQSVMDYIEYWRPVDFSTWNGKLALGLIFIVLAAVLFSRRHWRMDEVLLMAFALWSGLAHVRFLDFAAIIIVPILAPRLKLFPPYEAKLDKPWLNAAIMVGVVASIVYFFPSASELQQRINTDFPVGALRFMQAHDMTGRIFHPGEFGGYIEWNAPEMKAFIDGRDTIFVYNGTFDDYVSAMLIKRPFEVLDKYRIDYVLLEPNRSLAYLLQHSPKWRLIYSDEAGALFERKPVE